MGRPTKLTAAEHEEVRAAVRERAGVRQQIAEHEKEIASLRRRFRAISSKALAKKFGVTQGSIRRVLSDEPYVFIKPEPAANVTSVG